MTHPLDYNSNPTAEQIQALAELREAGKVIYDKVASTPNSRERSTALTKIEEAMMWANKAITHN